VTTVAAWTLGIPATIAIVGFLATYWSNLTLARRKDRLERVNEQLKELYGPLLALISAADSAWTVFRKDYRPDGPFWDLNPEPTDAEGDAWRLWISTVFMPLNRQMRDLIVTKAHLLDEPTMPRCLLDLCAHVSAYEPILVRWQRNDFLSHKPALKFPKVEALRYARSSFTKLKTRQQDLLPHRARAKA